MSQTTEWMQNASYRELLQISRYSPAGSSWVCGRTGENLNIILEQKASELSQEQRDQISKEVGYRKCSGMSGRSE